MKEIRKKEQKEDIIDRRKKMKITSGTAIGNRGHKIVLQYWYQSLSGACVCGVSLTTSRSPPACDCLCQCRIVGSRRQLSSNKTTSECRMSVRQRRHRDSSCPANCMLHPTTTPTATTVTPVPTPTATTSFSVDKTSEKCFLKKKKQLRGQAEPEILVCSSPTRNGNFTVVYDCNNWIAMVIEVSAHNSTK